MKFQKSTLILMLSALLMGGIVYIWEQEGRPQIEAAKAKENQIFDFQEKDVEYVLLKTKDMKLEFQRNIQQINNRTAPKWLLKVLEKPKQTEEVKDTKVSASPEAKATEPAKDPKATASPEAKATEQAKDPKATASPEAKATEQAKDPKATASPEAKATEPAKDPKTTPSPAAKATEPAKDQQLAEVPANEAYVAYLLDLLAKAKGDRIPTDPRIEDGLDQPLATVEVKLNNQQTHQLILGKTNFNNTFLYALADPPNQVKQPLEMLLVSPDFQNAVERPLSDWKQPEEKKPNSDQGSEKPSPESSKQEDNQKSEKPAAKSPK